MNNGERRVALALAQQFYTLPPNQAGPADQLVGERMLGASLYYLGDLSNSQRHLEHVLGHCADTMRRSHIIRFQVDLLAAARGILARILWAQGFQIRPYAWPRTMLRMRAPLIMWIRFRFFGRWTMRVWLHLPSAIWQPLIAQLLCCSNTR
jgi:hypothetical protein